MILQQEILSVIRARLLEIKPKINSTTKAEKIANKEWDAVARLYSLFRAEELMLSSEVLGQKQARGEEELDASDIEDLRDELTIFID